MNNICKHEHLKFIGSQDSIFKTASLLLYNCLDCGSTISISSENFCNYSELFTFLFGTSEDTDWQSQLIHLPLSARVLNKIISYLRCSKSHRQTKPDRESVSVCLRLFEVHNRRNTLILYERVSQFCTIFYYYNKTPRIAVSICVNERVTETAIKKATEPMTAPYCAKGRLFIPPIYGSAAFFPRPREISIF